MNLVGRLWKADAPLTATGVLMLAALAGAMIGLVFDPREITGAPAWLKPAKFAISTAIYTFTLAWVFTFLPAWTRTRRLVGWTTAVVLVIEVAIINLQAWRGTTSHFNVGTPMDAVLFGVMGVLIVVQTVTSVTVAAALWRQRFADPALGWALRLGLTLTIAGAATGGLMTQPTADQLAGARATHAMPVAGAHTVGAADGGPGVPGTGWSTAHGDLRVPHFIGLHAVQMLPLIILGVRRVRGRRTSEVALTLTAAASYAGLFALLLWQALRGQSIVDPDAATLTALAVWAALSGLLVWIATGRGAPVAVHAM